MIEWDLKPWRGSKGNLFSYINVELCREREGERDGKGNGVLPIEDASLFVVM